MGIRITTWNVNGIRNPFGYQPWRDKRTFEGMFDILEADMVIFQETKIQRKDLRDDMVLVPGWDNYWSLPKHKKGYSGVVIYTRNATCAPIRAEEGITGILTPPNTSTSFRELPAEEQIGGYPTAEQLSEADYDPATLDSEGRCVILEFPAFVLIGTYCPAERDETRTHYRTSYLRVLDARIRNLVKMGKRVVWAGDFNISREEIDTAAAQENMRKNGLDPVQWISTPARRMFNQLLVGGKVHGERDDGRERPIMWDVCRSFHEGRKGMYTCWETRVNARPGNYGSRIDYVVCSHDMKDWFSDANIQEGLMGSDHCPVYAVLKDTVVVDGVKRHMLDMVNPPGMFVNGLRKQEWTTKYMLPMSGKLIQEFDKRQSIRDMFTRKPTLLKSKSRVEETHTNGGAVDTPVTAAIADADAPMPSEEDDMNALATTVSNASANTKGAGGKRPAKALEAPTAAKRSKTTPLTTSNGLGKGQQSLKGFFSAKTSITQAPKTDQPGAEATAEELQAPATPRAPPSVEEEAAGFAARQTWGKLFSKPVAPKCEHGEPCKTMLTKKPGANCGRSFWMCARPLGPNGKQEKGTQWRCNTFIWASDWDAHAAEPG
ncbi:exodeoxyribonuclease III [Cladophialophora bantiana CBS 173.52]|uniref:DNA-(apurinic or apyrimidinic site) endonuclease 2 n=1 Tax=Cladophialophora bantiana (strain ATCC 10958 / CBS 173.52 / CDC B-1940 / NIH 8579) TaxID=1442370 RepID=A0A0D2G336_CLAB1|nr:exodeoxyribonuclease III [Cladophialophora bantiana CBS 173.52]KIW93082.1 exodeoxyribonuclease III [Cladophialophora bantiana CBS 173.52]